MVWRSMLERHVLSFSAFGLHWPSLAALRRCLERHTQNQAVCKTAAKLLRLCWRLAAGHQQLSCQSGRPYTKVPTVMLHIKPITHCYPALCSTQRACMQLHRPNTAAAASITCLPVSLVFLSSRSEPATQLSINTQALIKQQLTHSTNHSRAFIDSLTVNPT